MIDDRIVNMLRTVGDYARAGRVTIIVVDNERHAGVLAMHLADDVRQKIHIVTWDSRRWNPLTMEFRGVPKDAAVFVDPVTIERRYAHVFQALHAWDAK